MSKEMKLMCLVCRHQWNEMVNIEHEESFS